MTRPKLWQPSTTGEEWFQDIYRHVGHPLNVRHSDLTDLDYLVGADSFVEAVKLTATMDVALRCVRQVKELFEELDHPSADRVGRYLRSAGDLPPRLVSDRLFLERTLKTAEVARDKPRNKAIEASIYGRGRQTCYMCGEVVRLNGHDGKPYAIEHLWPQSLGGETTEENLLNACSDCNNKRMHQVTWATGPVHSTWLKSAIANPNVKPSRKNRNEIPAEDLVLSLALARLITVANGQSELNGGVAISLKSAALLLGPLKRTVAFPPRSEGRRYTFFELMHTEENMA
ncbi:5-methylcytosine-specific restriction endonuclease McrA [Luteibacter sp. HA06]